MDKLRQNNGKYSFTLAEIISVIAILGVVAAITIPSVIYNIQKKTFVTKAKRVYSNLQRATEIFQIEEGCVDNIQGCIANMGSSPSGFDAIARNLDVVSSTKYKFLNETVPCEDSDADCVNGEKTIKNSLKENLNKDWLPEITTLYNGTTQSYSWQGVSKFSTETNTWGGDNNYTGLYLLKDGTTISVQLPDDKKLSGFGFFDVNGKKGPNKVGVDVYPFGFGIPYDYNNAAQKTLNEQRYGSYARNFNPYYNEDNGWGCGNLCAVRNGSFCDNDSRNNPTMWLLIHNQVPND